MCTDEVVGKGLEASHGPLTHHSPLITLYSPRVWWSGLGVRLLGCVNLPSTLDPALLNSSAGWRGDIERIVELSGRSIWIIIRKSLDWHCYLSVLLRHAVTERKCRFTDMIKVQVGHRNCLERLRGVSEVIGIDRYCQVIVVSNSTTTTIHWIYYEDCANSFP